MVAQTSKYWGYSPSDKMDMEGFRAILFDFYMMINLIEYENDGKNNENGNNVDPRKEPLRHAENKRAAHKAATRKDWAEQRKIFAKRPKPTIPKLIPLKGMNV